MGIYEYNVYLLGYKINPKNLVKWFEQYGLEKYNINLSSSLNESVSKLPTEERVHIKNVANKISGIFDGINLYCDNGIEAYIVFTGFEKEIKQIETDCDKEIGYIRKQNRIRIDIKKTENKLEELYKQLKDKDYNPPGTNQTVDYGKLSEESIEELKEIEKKRQKEMLKLTENIPIDVKNKAIELFKEIEQYSEPEEIKLIILQRQWDTYSLGL